MAYSIRKNWVTSFELIRTHPVILLPFIIGAFFEGLALELIYFSTRKPLSFIASPLIKKFLGEEYIHYPGNLVMLPNVFYYAQVALYIFIGVLMMAIAVNIFKNIRANLPLRADAIIKNALKRYISIFIFAVMMVVLIFLIKKADVFLFNKCAGFAARHIPRALHLIDKLYFPGISLSIFLTNVILQAFFILTVPILVMQKKPLLKALAKSIYLSLRNFLYIFIIILLPFVVYLPISLLKSASTQMIDKTFPEITLLIAGSGVVIALFIDCFITVCAAQFVLDKEPKDI